MALTTGDFSTLTQKLNHWYNESMATAISDWVGKDYYMTDETNWQVFTWNDYYGVTSYSPVAEGGQYPTTQSEQGDAVNLTQRQFGGRIGVTKAMRLFDRYNQMENIVRTEVDGAFDKLDQAMADILTNGFTGSTFTDVWNLAQSNLAADGVVLFSASHTNNHNANVFSNLIANSTPTTNPAIDRDPIVATVAAGRKYRDPLNLNRPVKLDRLLVSATKYDLAQRIVYSQGVQGTPNVDSNPLRADVNSLVLWSRLDQDAAGNDRSARWFMCDSRQVKESLLSPFAQRPTFYAPEQVNDSKTWEYTIDGFHVMGLGHAKNIHGSTGAN